MVDILVLDGRDERLRFLGLDGILTATCCPNCVGFLKSPAFNSFTLDGGVEVFPSELFDGLRLRASAQTTANLNPHLFLRGYYAYGFKDEKSKYKAEVVPLQYCRFVLVFR